MAFPGFITQPFASYQTRDSGKLTADANGFIPSAGLSGFALADLINSGCVPLSSSPSAPALRNILDGGDFTTNPWQRDCAGLATAHTNTTAIANTFTYFPDRWGAIGGASSAIQLTNVADTTVTGFSQSCLFSRKAANTDVAALNFGQVINPADVVKLQGQQVTLSFWARTAANYSGGSLNVSVPTGTGNLANCTEANMISGSWTGDADVLNVNQALTPVMTRYSFGGMVPPGATELGAQFTWTPIGTAGALDGIYLNGLQLEPGGLSPFQGRDALSEMERCQRFAWLFPEPADLTPVVAGISTASAVQNYAIPLPVQMWKAPAVSVGAGSFKVCVAAGFVAGTTVAAGTKHTSNTIMVTSANTGAAGVAAMLGGGGGSGYILASADF